MLIESGLQDDMANTLGDSLWSTSKGSERVPNRHISHRRVSHVLNLKLLKIRYLSPYRHS